MKTKLLLATIVTILLLTGCISKSSVEKEKFNKIFQYIHLDTLKDEAIFYIENQKDITKFDNLYKDLQSIVDTDIFTVGFDCSFEKKTEKKFYTRFNDTYTVINGDYNINDCKKRDTTIVFHKEDIVINDNSITFEKTLNEEEILNTYLNFMIFLYFHKFENDKTLTNKYNIAIPFSLDLESFKQNKLIMNDELLSQLSLKDDIEKMLLENKYKVTNDKSKANITIELENLAFGNHNTTDEKYRDMIIMENRKGNHGGGLIQGSSGNLVLDSIALTFNAISFISFLADVKDDIVKPKNNYVYTINKIKIKEKSKIIETFLNTYIHKKYTANIFNDVNIKHINTYVASNLVEHRIKHRNGEN